VGLRKRHRHVEVRDAGLEARIEDGGVEEWVDRVEDDVGSGLSDQRDYCLLARRVDCVRREAAVVELGRKRRRSRGVVVGERAVLEEGSPSRDLREGRPDPARSDDENPHGARVLHERPQL
jgi:hypothetical protein